MSFTHARAHRRIAQWEPTRLARVQCHPPLAFPAQPDTTATSLECPHRCVYHGLRARLCVYVCICVRACALFSGLAFLSAFPFSPADALSPRHHQHRQLLHVSRRVLCVFTWILLLFHHIVQWLPRVFCWTVQSEPWCIIKRCLFGLPCWLLVHVRWELVTHALPPWVGAYAFQTFSVPRYLIHHASLGVYTSLRRVISSFVGVFHQVLLSQPDDQDCVCSRDVLQCHRRCLLHSVPYRVLLHHDGHRYSRTWKEITTPSVFSSIPSVHLLLLC